MFRYWPAHRAPTLILAGSARWGKADKRPRCLDLRSETGFRAHEGCCRSEAVVSYGWTYLSMLFYPSQVVQV